MADPIRRLARTAAGCCAAAFLAPAAGAAPAAAPPAPVPVAMHQPGPGRAASLLHQAFDDRVTETRDLPTWALQRARRRMLAGERISYDDMRALADHGDGLASFRYANRLMDLDRPDLLSAAALYYATAAYTGRDYAIGPLVRLLTRRDIPFTEARLRHLETALRAFALRGNEQAIDALTGFYSTGHPFGLQPERAAELQRDLAAAGNAEAALDLIMQVMAGRGIVAERDEIEDWFDTLAASDDLGDRATAQNLRSLFEAAPARYAAAGAAPETEEAAP